MLLRFFDWFRRWLRPAPEVGPQVGEDKSSMADLVRLLGDRQEGSR